MMFGGGGGARPPPPPPPPPPANPPTYASTAAAAPQAGTGIGRFGALSQSILTGPMGAADIGATQRKSLLGQ
jgi:hypothetical protein